MFRDSPVVAHRQVVRHRPLLLSRFFPDDLKGDIHRSRTIVSSLCVLAYVDTSAWVHPTVSSPKAQAVALSAFPASKEISYQVWKVLSLLPLGLPPQLQLPRGFGGTNFVFLFLVLRMRAWLLPLFLLKTR